MQDCIRTGWGEPMRTDVNPLNAMVVTVFGNPLTALWISLGILIGCVLIIVYNRRRYHVPVSRVLEARLKALRPIRSAGSVDEAQAVFADEFANVNEAMVAGGEQASELRLAWDQFRETILDETETPMRATTRADSYFLHLGDDTRVLAWWANIFVAIGLTFTFLGIVAALTATVIALESGQGTSSMTGALIRLLEITSVKFWTSIAGVSASIILRWFDRRWHSATQRKLEELSELLDRGTLFSPPQRLAALQLHEAREQTTALKTFSHDLALAIGDRLESQMAPMVGALGGIQASIDDFKSGSFNEIGRELGEALSRQAGTEMDGLATALTGMTDGLRGVNERLEGSSQAASDQIAAAARDFLAASDSIARAFGTLNERIDGMGARLVEQSEEAARRAEDHAAQERAAYQALADEQRNAIRATGTSLQAEATAAADRNAEMLTRAAAALEEGTKRAASGLTAAIDETISRAAEESGRVMSDAFASFGERFDKASEGLVTTLRAATARMEEVATSFERSARASDEHATRLTQVGHDTQGVAATLSRAANDVQGAAGPIRAATEIIGASVTRTSDALADQARAADAHVQAIATIGDRLGATTESATSAWTSYRDRFEEVDAALAVSLDQMKAASAEHAAHLNEQVGKIDLALANAVDRLSAALEPLTELAEQIDDLIGRLPQAA